MNIPRTECKEAVQKNMPPLSFFEQIFRKVRRAGEGICGYFETAQRNITENMPKKLLTVDF